MLALKLAPPAARAVLPAAGGQAGRSPCSSLPAELLLLLVGAKPVSSRGGGGFTAANVLRSYASREVTLEKINRAGVNKYH